MQNSASSGGTRPIDWTEVDRAEMNAVSGGSKRANRAMKREDLLRRHTVTGDPMIALPPTRSSSANMISNNNHQHVMESNNMVIVDSNGISSTLPSHTYTAQRSHSMYQPPSSIYDDDPGIMSEAETSATGFRRGIKQRSSLPVVRTPNKSLERPLGLVFLQFRSETKRALLPNEITSLDTVKALFVRSFPHQLSMEYLESPHLRIYIHDPSKDMFYELEDLRDVKDRSVLRIYEHDVNGGAPMSTWDQDMSYFSEPEFDSEYQNQHIHRAKGSSKSAAPVSSSYYGVAHTATTYVGGGRTATLPHHSQMVSYYSSPGYASERNKSHPSSDIGSRTLPLPGSVHAPPKPHRVFQQPVTSMAKSVRAISAPPQGPPPPVPSPRTNQAGTADRRLEQHRSYPMYITPSSSYEDPYYGERQYPVSGTVTPVIDEDARRDGYLLPANGIQTVDQLRYRARVEYMERQLASLTGLVHKALTTSRPPAIQRDIEISLSRDLLQVPQNNSVAIYKGGSGDDCKPETKTIPRPLSKEEKSVSFSDDPPTMSSPTHTKQHSPQHTDRENRHTGKPAPPPKPSSLGGGGSHEGKLVHQLSGREIQITPEVYSQLRMLKKKTKDLKVEVRNLRRITQSQSMNIKESIREAFVKIKAILATAEPEDDQVRAERNRVSREEEMYRQDIAQLENSLSDLETAVEELRSNVINRRCRVNMSEVESMALVLSKASKTVADLKGRYPSLQENLKSVMAAEMEVIIREERFLKEEPERLENALRRCKKLTGTLVTLKRLASVQEQRLPPASPGLEHGRAASLPSSASLNEQHLEGVSVGPDGQITKAASFSGDMSRQSSVTIDGSSSQCSIKGEHALDALLDELQTAAVPAAITSNKPANELASKNNPDSSSNHTPPKRFSSHPSIDSPLRGQIVSQGSSGTVSLAVTSTPVTKLQVNDGGSRHSVNLSPSLSPVPSTTDGKTSPQPVEFRSLRQQVMEGPTTTDANNSKTPSPSPPVTGAATVPTTQPIVTTVGQIIKKVPPPPPPRTSSKSPLVSPTSPMSPSVVLAAGGRYPPPIAHRSYSLQVTPTSVPPEVPARPSSENRKSLLEAAAGGRRAASLNGDLLSDRDGSVLRTLAISDENLIPVDQLSSNSSSSESVNSQEGLSQKLANKSNSLDGEVMMSGATVVKPATAPPTPPTRNRQEILEQRHQELLRRQRQLQEQYARLQQMQRGQTLHRFSPPRSPAAPPADLKKTGSESNILSKAGLSLSTTTSGSLTHLAPVTASAVANTKPVGNNITPSGGQVTNKIYETDIL
ncbi:hypothetical protein CHUAL_013163 [Chamberlinius hualienensis]